jgi:hypothetical protein
LRAELDGTVPHGPPAWDLYRFIVGTPAANRVAMEAGVIPWWSAPELRVRLVRPLASILFAVDHRVFGNAPLGYHLHSIVWYAVLVAVVGLLLRQVLPRATAHLAMLVFALSSAHVLPFGWISCRHSVMAATFGLLGVAMQLRDPSFRGAIWLALGLAGGLASGETAVGVLAYPFALALFDRRAPVAQRIARLAPAIAVFAGYAVLYRAMGGGAACSAGYVDPVSTPARFLTKAGAMLPIAAGNALLGVPLELANVVPLLTLAAVGIAATMLVATLTRACAASMAAEERAGLPWLVTGAVLAVVPSLGGFPGARLLLVSNVGVAALLAVLVRRGLGGRGLRRGAAVFLAVVHLVVAPLASLGNESFNAGVSRTLDAIVAHAELPVGTPAPRVFVIGSSDPIVNLYVPAHLLANEPHRIACWSLVSAAKGPHRITRVDASTILARPLDGPLLRGPFETLYRAPYLPMHAGDESRQCGATYRVTEVDAIGRPTAFEVRFDAPLEDESLRLVTWKDGAIRALAAPKPGESLDVAWEVGPLGMF